MSAKSRNKGARGERDAAKFLAEFFSGAARGASQTRGGGVAPDVDGAGRFWVEVKLRKSPEFEKWVAQAERDAAGKGLLPVVMAKADYKEWVVMMRASEFFGKFEESNGRQENT